MQSRPSSDHLFQAFLAPWKPVMNNAAVVIALRLSLLPGMWLQNPKAADRETRKMVNEKQVAWQELQIQAWQAPMRFWMDVATATFAGQAVRAMERAVGQSGRRLARPYAARVSANRRRLGHRSVSSPARRRHQSWID